VNAPSQIPWGSIPPGGFASKDMVAFVIKVNDNTALNVATGVNAGTPPANDTFWYYPNAQIIF
jgi:hypothetical protein